MLKQYIPYLVPLLIVALVAWRMSRALKGRPVKPSRLWIRPALITVVMVLVFATSPSVPTPFWLAIFAGAAVVGAGLGYLLSRHQELTLDPVSDAITSKTSPFGVVLFVVLFVGRFVFRTSMQGGLAPGNVAAHSAQITLSTDAALLFLLGLVCAQAWEIWRRTRPLVAEHAARTVKTAAD